MAFEPLTVLIFMGIIILGVAFLELWLILAACAFIAFLFWKYTLVMSIIAGVLGLSVLALIKWG